MSNKYTVTVKNVRTDTENRNRTKNVMYVDFPESMMDGRVTPRSPEFKEVQRMVRDMSGDQEARWNWKAGCRCGCSPGFVSRKPITWGHSRMNVWLTVEENQF